jgi:hypothetical protein
VNVNDQDGSGGCSMMKLGLNLVVLDEGVETDRPSDDGQSVCETEGGRA